MSNKTKNLIDTIASCNGYRQKMTLWSHSYPLSVNDNWNKEWLFFFRAFIGPLITSRVNLLSSEFFFRMKLNLVPRQLWFSMYLLFFCIYIFCVNNVKWYDNGNQSSAFKSVSSFSIIPELKIVLTKNSKLSIFCLIFNFYDH